MSSVDIKLEAKKVALERIRELFGMAIEEVRETSSFQEDFPSLPVSDWEHNAYDILSEDILDMHGALGDDLRRCDPVNTVGDWCTLVERCAQQKPKAFLSMFRDWEKEKRMKTAPLWRRRLYKLIGV